MQGVKAWIGLAVPSRPIGPWPRGTGAPKAPVTGLDRTPCSRDCSQDAPQHPRDERVQDETTQSRPPSSKACRDQEDTGEYTTWATYCSKEPARARGDSAKDLAHASCCNRPRIDTKSSSLSCPIGGQVARRSRSFRSKEADGTARATAADEETVVTIRSVPEDVLETIPWTTIGDC